MKYSFSDIYRGFANPKLVVKEFLYLFHRYTTNINRSYYRHSREFRGSDFLLEDWDNLLIMDGARPDFVPSERLETQVQTKISRGSDSWEFMEENFLGKELHDTIYITANPHAFKLPEGIFFKIINLLDSKWDEELETVLPEHLVSATLDCYEEHPDKRYIVHFMQPHYPFIGPTAKKLPQQGIILHKDNHQGNHDDPWTQLNVWGRFASVSRENVLNAYRENHEIALDAALNLSSNINGKTIITADHANLIGERGFPIPARIYGHPPKFHKE